ncbi:TonB-dependent receptor [Paracraurococcus lichenis]|uniref:TonB-dependent receptor n=1 Tax=Paracraurococcus lichenis TaxID=3064888 RepID=A0ABT9EBD5_9PROT|nr:TonB-dependent receptor [Paracraurococcus sp. LOR1-02]MDO9713512.1 TonB-dependent receptor [Paracraurococcus sp. LOR1-02]
MTTVHKRPGAATDHHARVLAPLGLAVAVSIGGPAAAQETAPTTILPTVEAVGTTPLTSTGLPRDRIAGNPRTFSAADLSRDGAPNLVDNLVRLSGSMSLNDTQGNPFAPDLQYRGFTASPLVGTPQGIAVYQNGVRINEAFGDTVNWDLIPSIAIRGADLLGSSPLFGLNATGGALNLRMKTGFDAQGGRVDVSGGSFGRVGVAAEYGKQVGNVAAYLAIESLNEDGWRRYSPSRARRLYGDVGFQGERATLNLSIGAGSTALGGNGPTPVQLLSANRRDVFTYPDRTYNRMTMLQARGTYEIAANWSLETNAYVRTFRQRTLNADIAEFERCDDDDLAGLFCFEDGPPLTARGGGTVGADLLGDGVPGVVNRTGTNTTGAGGTAQIVSTEPILGRPARVVFGVSYDHADTDFSGSTELGLVTPDRTVAGTGVFLDSPAGGIADVRLKTTNAYWGLYGSGTIDLTPRLAATIGARFNDAQIRLRDQLGTALNGDHSYSRFNPTAGLTWRALDSLTAYASYAEANRAPTPAELSCADPLLPCTLGAFFLADPKLKQVVSRTWETGLRGTLPAAWLGGRASWNLGLFRTDLSDDILLVQSEIQGRGYFQNAGDTRRQGIEAGLAWRNERLALSLDYAMIDATFRTAQRLPSPNHPDADANGTIPVERGDRLPGIPRHRIRFDAEWRATEAWRIGGNVVFNSDQYLRGDEANLLKPIAGYAVVNLRTAVTLMPGIELYGLVRNLFDQPFSSFGTLYNLQTAQALNLGLTDPRTVTPGLPRAFYGGLRFTF